VLFRSLIARRQELARILEGRPDDVLDGCGAGCVRGVLRLSLLLLAREVLPEVRHDENPVRAGEGLLQAFDVVEIGLDDLRALARERFGFVLARIAGDGPAREAAG